MSKNIGQGRVREYPFKMEDLFPGKEFSIQLRSLTVKERNAVNEEFIGLSEAEQDDFKYAVAFLAKALVKEPAGFENFPDSEGTLEERAKKYFLDLPPEWEEAIVLIFNSWNKGGRPSFFTKPSES